MNGTNNLDKSKVMEYYGGIWWGEQDEEYQVAKTMYALKSDVDGLTMDELYRLALRMNATQNSQCEPFLNAELNDALRCLLGDGYLDDSGYELQADDAVDVLLSCPQEVFDYMVLATACENQGRYAAGVIERTKSVGAWMDENSEEDD